MTSSNSHKVALVTGSGSGIGRRTAEKLAIDQGVRVYVLDKDAEAAIAVAEEINSNGGIAKACVLNLADGPSLKQALPKLMEEFGPPDILVNNAGVASLVAAEDCSLESWQLTLAVNITAPMLLMQYVLPHMRKAGWGRIVNVASISGLRAGTGRMAYGTSKAALIAMTRQFAIEVGSWGITANSIAPGAIDTPLAQISHSSETRAAYGRMVPMGRYGSTDEVADSIVFLCSEQASYVTGQTLAIDGGFVAAGMLVNELVDKSAA